MSAAGRNGGHVAPYTPDSFGSYTTPLAEGGAGLKDEEAVKVIYHEMDNFEYVSELVQDKGWDVDLWRGTRYEGELVFSLSSAANVWS